MLTLPSAISLGVSRPLERSSRPRTCPIRGFALVAVAYVDMLTAGGARGGPGPPCGHYLSALAGRACGAQKPMCETLTKGLRAARDRLSGRTELTAATVEQALGEVRLTLLEADVEFNVVKRFLER